MIGRLICAGVGAISLGVAPALAADTVYTCPAGSLLLFRDGGEATDLVIAVGSKSVTVKLPSGEVELPATIEERGGMIGIRAQGEALAPMPDRAMVDACLDKQKQADPTLFEDGENAYLALGCKNKATMTEPVPVLVRVELTVIEPPNAMLALSRHYADESGAVAERHGVDTLGECTTAK